MAGSPAALADEARIYAAAEGGVSHVEARSRRERAAPANHAGIASSASSGSTQVVVARFEEWDAVGRTFDAVARQIGGVGRVLRPRV